MVNYYQTTNDIQKTAMMERNAERNPQRAGGCCEPVISLLFERS
jgi:hypothetical protein